MTTALIRAGAGLAGRAGPAGRAFWRWLTSMRTALILLFLLALAAIPGSLLPQRNLNIENVLGFLDEYPRLGPLLDRLWFFEVYSSPWFSAIYLLLFASLVGCLIPRLRQHLSAVVSVPPDAPKRLDRLPHHADGGEHDGDPATAAANIRRRLKEKRWRTVVREHDDGTVTVSAEKGHLKETGNLVFHFSLLVVLVGVALGSWYGWHGNRLVVAGAEYGFCNTLQQYDEYGLGARLDPADLAPFCLRLRDFHATYQESGQPVDYTAEISYVDGGGGGVDGPERDYTLKVNDPLRLDGASVYLLGHGYAPVLRYTDKYGQAQTTVAPFPFTDEMLTSEGVAVFPDANVPPGAGALRDPDEQIGFEGTFVPTLPNAPMVGASLHPEQRDPGLRIVAYKGNLGLDSGRPQSVYRLDLLQIEQKRLERFGEAKLMRIGDTWTLPDGTRLEFLAVQQWIAISVRHDPGSVIVLGSVVFLLGGLMISLTGRRRRIWARVTATGPGVNGSGVTWGGLPRSDFPGFADEFAEIVTGPEPAPREAALAGRNMTEGQG